jgi:hypothetical protein
MKEAQSEEIPQPSAQKGPTRSCPRQRFRENKSRLDTSVYNMSMRMLVGGLAIGSLLLGQDFGNLFDKAPPHIEEALRSRISHFYQSHVDGKFRLADQVVHEDSKDVFFGAEKPKYESFKIASIRYEENYTKARVVVATEVYFVMPGFGAQKVPRPVPSLWKYVDDQWWWYVEPYDAQKGRGSPFGTMRETQGADAPTQQIVAGLANAEKLRQSLQSALKASKTEVALSSISPSEDQITLVNKWEGKVTLNLDAPEALGLDIKLDKNTLEQDETAKLLISYKPHNKAWKADMNARVNVQPTGQVVSIRISFALPPKESEPTNRAVQPAAPPKP